MATHVYFHVGAPKTGTTFLQGVMRHNREALREQGVLYPGATARDHLHASQVVREVTKHPRRADRVEAWDRLVAELAEWPGVGVISHEFFGMATEEQARSALEQLAPAEVHIVLTARDYVRQFAADWQESLKMSLDLTLDAFLRRADRDRLPRPWGWNAHDIVGTLERWGGSVPPERVHLVTVPQSGAPRDLLLRRFCSVVQVDPDTLDLGAAFSNQSLGVVQAELLRRLKPHLSTPLDDAPERHRWLRGYFAHEVLLAQNGDRFTLRPEQAEVLAERGRAAIEAIRSAGYDVVGDLDELVPAPLDPDLRHPSDVTDSEVLESALVAIERMLTDVRTLTLQRDRLRARASKRFVPRVRTRVGRALSRRSR
jgi:hypothetical protein